MQASNESARALWKGPLCVTLLLVAPFISFTHYHQYSFFTVEIFIIFGVLISAGLSLGLLVAVSQRFLQAFLLALLVAVSLDLFLLEASLAFLLASLPVSYFAIRILQRHIFSIISIMCFSVILSNAIVPSQSVYRYSEITRPGSSELPPIIHVILDAYMNVGVLPLEVDGGKGLREETMGLFVQNGFKVTGGAYSQYLNTYNSIGNTLNFESSPVDESHVFSANRSRVLRASRYFELLAAWGYRFRIYQSSYLDYCQVSAIPLVSCLTYERSSIKNVEDAPLSPMHKAEFILAAYGRVSILRGVVRFLYNRLQALEFASGILPFWKASLTTSVPIPSLTLFDRLAEDISRTSGGEVFFAHLIMPHSAYILDEDCVIREDLETWRGRKSVSLSFGRANTNESRIDTYNVYVKQLRCTNQLLAEFFGKLRRADKFESAIIILHGDHGSRINLSDPNSENLEQLVDSDFEDGFTTLFAAKLPGSEPGYSDTRKTLSALLAETMGEKGPEETRVFLFNGTGETMTPHPMPNSWLSNGPSFVDHGTRPFSEVESNAFGAQQQ